MSKGLDSKTKEKILELLKNGETTKEILTQVTDGEERQIRSFIQYSKKRSNDPGEVNNDMLGSLEYIDELELKIKEKDEEIEKIRSEIKRRDIAANNKFCELNSKVETLKDINKKLLSHV